MTSSSDGSDDNSSRSYPPSSGTDQSTTMCVHHTRPVPPGVFSISLSTPAPGSSSEAPRRGADSLVLIATCARVGGYQGQWAYRFARFDPSRWGSCGVSRSCALFTSAPYPSLSMLRTRIPGSFNLESSLRSSLRSSMRGSPSKYKASATRGVVFFFSPWSEHFMRRRSWALTGLVDLKLGIAHADFQRQ